MNDPTQIGQEKASQQPEFIMSMGLFHLTCSVVDLITDYAIFKFLNVSAQQAHLITSGMAFGRKSKLLSDLVGRSDHPKKSEILGIFGQIRANKRDIITHSYLWSGPNSVKFIHRQISGEYKATEYEFTGATFVEHVMKFHDDSIAFYNILADSYDEVQEFAKASLSLDRKSNKSPVKPTSKR